MAGWAGSGPGVIKVRGAACMWLEAPAGGWRPAGRLVGKLATLRAMNGVLGAEWMPIGFPQLGDDEVVASTAARGRRHRGRAHGFLSMGALSVIQTAWDEVWRSGGKRGEGSMPHI
jgi:hypothetical protein